MKRFLSRMLGRKATRTESGRQVRKRHPGKIIRRQLGVETLEERCLLNATPEQIGLINCDSSTPQNGLNQGSCCKLTAQLEFFPNKPGTDVTGDGHTLVLQRGNPWSVSKIARVWVGGWESNTATRVEVLVLGPGGGPILSGSGIGPNLPNRLDVNPTEGPVANVVTSDAPGNMYNPGVTDPFFNPINNQHHYPFPLLFSAWAGGISGPTPTLIRVRQGNCHVDTSLNLLVSGDAPVSPLQATALSGTQVKLSWPSVARAQGYYVAYRLAGGQWMYLNNSQALGATSNSYTATGLSPGKAYEFAVGAFNSVNDPNPIWAVQTATTPAAQPSTTTPTAPAGAPIPLTVTATGATFINLSWKPVAGVDGYDLYVSSNGTGWQHFSLPANWGSVSVTGLTPGTTYTFALRAHYSSGFNSASAVDAALYDGDDE